jgi:hypothetical protein
LGGHLLGVEAVGVDEVFAAGQSLKREEPEAAGDEDPVVKVAQPFENRLHTQPRAHPRGDNLFDEQSGPEPAEGIGDTAICCMRPIVKTMPGACQTF